jgi:O-antigen ligase
MELPTPKRSILYQQLLMVLAFAIPWAKKAIPTIIAICFIVSIVQCIRHKKTFRPARLLGVAGLLSLFMLLIAGTLYTSHPAEGWNEIGIKLSFLIFPVFSIFLPNFGKTEIDKLQQSFLAGCFLFISITLVRAGINAFQHQHLYYLTYDQLSWYMHPTYAAAYEVFALFILVEQMLKKKYIAKSAVLHTCLCLLVLFFIGLLSSKAGYLSFVLLVGFSFIRSFHWKFPALRSAFIAFSSLLLFALIIVVLPTSAGRIEKAVEDIRAEEKNTSPTDSLPVKGQTSSTRLRTVTWGASWTLLAEHAFGTGTGDTQPELNTLYLQRGETYAAERQLNAHNQYLQTGAELGWFGICALLACLSSLWYARKIEISSLFFGALCALNFLFESMLEVQAGIVFFCFWVIVYSKLTTHSKHS